MTPAFSKVNIWVRALWSVNEASSLDTVGFLFSPSYVIPLVVVLQSHPVNWESRQSTWAASQIAHLDCTVWCLHKLSLLTIGTLFLTSNSTNESKLETFQLQFQNVIKTFFNYWIDCKQYYVKKKTFLTFLVRTSGLTLRW